MTDQQVHAVASAIRDANAEYLEVSTPELVGTVEDWYPEARAAIAVMTGGARDCAEYLQAEATPWVDIDPDYERYPEVMA